MVLAAADMAIPDLDDEEPTSELPAIPGDALPTETQAADWVTNP